MKRMKHIMIVMILGLMCSTIHAADKPLKVFILAGDKTQYPEFANNVKCIDTTEFARDAKSFYYNNNAASFLEIGEAMGKAMVELQGK